MICEYFGMCKTARETGRNCADYKTCNTYKMFKSMGVRFYGIRTMNPEDIGRLEKEIKDGSTTIP